MHKHKLTRRFSTVLSVVLLTVMLMTMTGASASTPVDYNVTTPREFLGYEIGQDYKLTPYLAHELPG